METLAVLFGGRSSEHEISIITAIQAIQALDSTRYHIIPVYLAMNGKWYSGSPLLERAFYKHLTERLQELEEVSLLPDPTLGGLLRLRDNKVIPVDVCLLAFHGQYGENGCVQGLLELADLPYAGSRVLGSSLTMSKAHAKAVLKAHGFTVLPWLTIHKSEVIRSLSEVRKKILETLTFPLFIKPNHLGSSIAIAKAFDEASLDRALASVFQYDETAIIEPLLTDFTEVNIAVLDGDPPIASLVEMPLASCEGVLSYEDKYLRGGSKKTGAEETNQGMAGLSRVIDPQDLDSKIKETLIEQAIKAFQLLHCSGVCRFDFMLNLKDKTSIFNEANGIPGSLSFYLWNKKNPPLLYTELLNKMIERAKQVKAMQRSLKQDFGFYALS